MVEIVKKPQLKVQQKSGKKGKSIEAEKVEEMGL